MPKDKMTIEDKLDASVNTVYSVDAQIDKMLVSFEKSSVAPTDIEESNHENLKRNAFKELLREMLLFEQDEDKPKDEDEDAPDEPTGVEDEATGDVDIDALLGGDEGPAGGGGADEGGDIGDPGEDLGAPPGGGGMGGGGGGGGFGVGGGDKGGGENKKEKPAEEKPAEEKIERKPLLNIEAYSANVYRLMENYENLLNMRDAIMNRAIKYIEKAYDEDTAFMVKQAIKFNFGD